jgi:hypothetical protein
MTLKATDPPFWNNLKKAGMSKETIVKLAATSTVPDYGLIPRERLLTWAGKNFMVVSEVLHEFEK